MAVTKEFTGDVKKRIEEIEQEGFSLSEQESRIISRRGYNPVSSGGWFDINKLSNLETKVTILSFKNEAGDSRYCIFDANNEIIREPLSRINYQDNRIKNSTAYKVHEFSKKLFSEVKSIFHTENLPEEYPDQHDILKSESKKFLTMSANDLSYMLYNNLAEIVNSPEYDTMKEDAIEKIAHKTATKYKEHIKEGIRKASEIRLNWTTDGWGSYHPGISISAEFNAGKDRQYNISEHFLEEIDAGTNSSGMNHIAIRVQELVRLVAKEMIENNEIVLDSDTAKDLCVSEEMLNKVISSGDKKILNDYLTRTKGVYVGGSAPAIDTEAHTLDADLLDALHKNILDNPEKTTPERLNSDLNDLLNDMTLYNRKLSKKECIDILVDYINTTLPESISYRNLKAAIIQPDFTSEIRKGESLKSVSHNLHEKSEKGMPIFEKTDYYYAGKVWQLMEQNGVKTHTKKELLLEANKKQGSDKQRWYRTIKESIKQKVQEQEISQDSL